MKTMHSKFEQEEVSAYFCMFFSDKTYVLGCDYWKQGSYSSNKHDSAFLKDFLGCPVLYN